MRRFVRVVAVVHPERDPGADADFTALFDPDGEDIDAVFQIKLSQSVIIAVIHGIPVLLGLSVKRAAEGENAGRRVGRLAEDIEKQIGHTGRRILHHVLIQAVLVEPVFPCQFIPEPEPMAVVRVDEKLRFFTHDVRSFLCLMTGGTGSRTIRQRFR